MPFQPVQPYAPEFFGENVLISFCARYPSAQAAPASLSEAVLAGECILLKAAPVSADAQGDGWWWEGFVEISRADIAALLRDGKPRTALEFWEYGGESSAAVPDTFRGSEEGTENIPIAEESRNPY